MSTRMTEDVRTASESTGVSVSLAVVLRVEILDAPQLVIKTMSLTKFVTALHRPCCSAVVPLSCLDRKAVLATRCKDLLLDARICMNNNNNTPAFILGSSSHSISFLMLSESLLVESLAWFLIRLFNFGRRGSTSP